MIDLSQHPELYVRQEIEHLEVFTGFETSNRYSVRTPSGEQLLYAFEESGLLGRSFPQFAPAADDPRCGQGQHGSNQRQPELLLVSFSPARQRRRGAAHRLHAASLLIPDAQVRPDGRNRQSGSGNARADLPAFHVHGLPTGTGNWPRHKAVERLRPGGVYRRRHLQGGSGHQPDGSGLLTAHAGQRRSRSISTSLRSSRLAARSGTNCFG